MVRLCYSDSALPSQRGTCHLLTFAIGNFGAYLIASLTDVADRVSSSINDQLQKAPQGIRRGMLGVAPYRKCMRSKT